MIERRPEGVFAGLALSERLELAHLDPEDRMDLPAMRSSRSALFLAGWMAGALLICPTVASAQVGFADPPVIGYIANPPGSPISSTVVPFTVFSTFYPASDDGTANFATFHWSNSPCTGAVKIKFLRLISENPAVSRVVEERGPFDVLHSPQTVALVPPVVFRRGDQIAITALTPCGQPLGSYGVNLGFGQRIVVIAGDLSGDFTVSTSDFRVGNVSIAGQSSTALHLLGNRFWVRLDATDPRTGRTTTGVGVKLGDGAGYFSLPEFTGDPAFPEVMVKIVDATSAPPPFGGSFWVFQSPLTDVEYTLEVRDTVAGQGLGYRIYTNSPTSGEQLCGTADTNAFPR